MREINGPEIAEFLENMLRTESRVSFKALIKKRPGREAEIEAQLIPQKGFCCIKKEKGEISFVAVLVSSDNSSALRYLVWPSYREYLKNRDGLHLKAGPDFLKKIFISKNPAAA